jgi:hypothetical protein
VSSRGPFNRPGISEHGDRAVCWQEEGVRRMRRLPEERAAQYGNYAAHLRLLADRTRFDMTRAQLRQLADRLDQLAWSMRHGTLVA